MNEMKDTKKTTRKRDFIITFFEEGRRAGGKYRSYSEALEVNSLFGKVKSIREGSMRSEWRSAA